MMPIIIRRTFVYFTFLILVNFIFSIPIEYSLIYSRGGQIRVWINLIGCQVNRVGKNIIQTQSKHVIRFEHPDQIKLDRRFMLVSALIFLDFQIGSDLTRSDWVDQNLTRSS